MKIAQQALTLWGLAGAQVRLVAARENAVYRVDHSGRSYALRLHRTGYRTDAQLAAELDWTTWISSAGISVPAPIPSHAGPHLQHVDDVQVDLLTWLEGETLDMILPTLDADACRDVFRDLGQTMARLHEVSDGWPGAATCDRPKWDRDGLLGHAPLWDRFWENPELTDDQKTLFQTFRTAAVADFTTLAHTLDYGLIHADLVPANVMCANDRLHLIDFDDGGFGFRLFEIATALLKHRDHPDFPDWQDALVDGYSAVRTIDLAALPLLMALRAVTYVGWNITRMTEDEGGARNARFIAQAVDTIEQYFKSRADVS